MILRLWQDSGCLLLWRIVAIEAIEAIEGIDSIDAIDAIDAIVGIVAMEAMELWGKCCFLGKKGEIVICFP